MPLYLTYCTNCTSDMPEFLNALEEIQQTYQDDLCVVEVDCMAACDTAPTVVLDDDILPRVSVFALRELVDHTIAAPYTQAVY